jgi:4-hydroxybenzoate polyprenyltransferase
VTSHLPDAAPKNWVDRYAPSRWRPWLKLARLDRPTGIWLLMLPGWQGIALAGATRHALPDPRLLALFAAGSALMRAAGCAFNDIVDRDFDARVARTALRPIPSGEITVRGAWAFLVICALASLGILLSLNLLCFWLGVASLGLVAAYPFMKRITWWPQAWLGLTFNWGALMGFAAAMGGPPLAVVLALMVGAGVAGTSLSAQVPPLPWPAVLLYVSGLFWTLGYDTIYALQDIEDDAVIGVKSSALRLGAAAPRAVTAFYALSLAFALMAGWAGDLGLMFTVAALAPALHLAWQTTRVDVRDPASALALFKSNSVAGLLLFVAIVVGGALSGPSGHLLPEGEGRSALRSVPILGTLSLWERAG